LCNFIRMKLCECGCGGEAPVSKRNDKRFGYVKGQPVRFIRGHSLKASQPWWRGDDASYRAKHTYLSKHYPKSGICEECGETKPTDYALIKGRQYSRDREDYRELCRGCHVIYDRLGVKRGPYGRKRTN